MNFYLNFDQSYSILPHKKINIIITRKVPPTNGAIPYSLGRSMGDHLVEEKNSTIETSEKKPIDCWAKFQTIDKVTNNVAVAAQATKKWIILP